MLFLMLSNYTFDALLHGQSIQNDEIAQCLGLKNLAAESLYGRGGVQGS